jgi:hypothetical protein
MPVTIEDLIPSGGKWTVAAAPGAPTRSIWFGEIEVATINPRGDVSDEREGRVAMGIAATPALTTALDRILDLARSTKDDPTGVLAKIGAVAHAALGYARRPAPAIPELDDDELAALHTKLEG